MTAQLKTQVRLPLELHTRLTRSAEASGRSMNAEIVHLLSAALGQLVEIPDYIEKRIREAAAESGRSYESEFNRRLHDATDIFIPALREALDPYRTGIQEAAKLNGSTLKQEIARRLNPDKSAITFGFELTIKNEADLTPAAALKFLADLMKEWPVEPANLGALTVKLVAPHPKDTGGQPNE